MADGVKIRIVGDDSEFERTLMGLGGKVEGVLGRLTVPPGGPGELSSLADGFGEAVAAGARLGNVLDSVNDICGIAEQAMESLAEVVAKALVGLDEPLAELLSAVGGGGAMDLPELGGDLRSQGLEMGASLPEGVATGVEGGSSRAAAAASALGSGILAALDAAVSASPGVEAGASIPEGVAIGIEQGAGQATAAATGAGAQVVAGMAQGILSGRSQVVTAAITVATAAAEAIRAALQIHSPSRVTRLFGEQVDLGFVEGIRDKLPEIQRTVASAFAIEPGVGRFELALASERSGDQRLSALSESFGRMASQLQEIRAAIPSGDRPVVLDGRRLVGGIRDEMNRQLGQTATWREGGHA